jgi:hypothetical protein
MRPTRTTGLEPVIDALLAARRSEDAMRFSDRQ